MDVNGFEMFVNVFVPGLCFQSILRQCVLIDEDYLVKRRQGYMIHVVKMHRKITTPLL